MSVTGNGDVEIIIPKVQGKQLGDVMFVFDNQDSALPDVTDINSGLSSRWDTDAVCSLADIAFLPESRPEISRMYHRAFKIPEKRPIFQRFRPDWLFDEYVIAT